MANRKTWTAGHAPARSTRRYRRHILVHHGHGLSLVVPVASFFVAGPWVAALVLLALEIVVILALPRVALVQRAIDGGLLARRRRDAVIERAAMIAQMSEQHRRDFADLEQIVGHLKQRMDLQSDRDDIVGLEQLAALYVRLALAHRVSTEALARVGQTVADHDVARTDALHHEAANDSDDTMTTSLDQRLDIMKLRCDARRRARRDVRAIEFDLTVIGDTIRWMNEYCATAGVEATRSELADRLASARIDADTVRELCSLRSQQAFAVFELARDVPLRSNALLVDAPPAARSAPECMPSWTTERMRVGPVIDDSPGDRSCEDLAPEQLVAAALRRA